MTCVCQRTNGKGPLLIWPSGKKGEEGGGERGDDGGGEEQSAWERRGEET